MITKTTVTCTLSEDSSASEHLKITLCSVDLKRFTFHDMHVVLVTLIHPGICILLLIKWGPFLQAKTISVVLSSIHEVTHGHNPLTHSWKNLVLPTIFSLSYLDDLVCLSRLYPVVNPCLVNVRINTYAHNNFWFWTYFILISWKLFRHFN